jgi:ADP-L-glycero-D-manno-heptose 6-epimerase
MLHVVTGAAGFIGSRLVAALNQAGVGEILAVDDLKNGAKSRNLAALEIDDYLDKRDFLAQLESGRLDGAIEAVLHQGACSDTTEANGRYMLSVNYEYSKRLLEWCAGRCAFLYASSAATYGDGKRGFREEPACEWPLNVYGFSKQLFDRYVRRVLPSAKTQVVGVRYFNVYGPQENHKGRMASVVFKFHGQATRREPLSIFEGSDKFVRDFVFVDDCVEVNLFFLDHPERRGVFNCGSGRAESFEKLAQATARHYAGAKIVHIPFPADLVGKYQDYTCADLTALRRAGYEREFSSLDAGVAAYVRVLQQSGGYFTSPART